MNFTSHIVRNHKDPIHHLWGKNVNGLDYHWIIMAPARNIKKLEQHLGGVGIQISEYGIILHKGLGHFPSIEAQDMLDKRYGYRLSSVTSQ